MKVQHELNRMNSQLLNQLWTTEGKTTDMLERLVGKSLSVHVIQQQINGIHMLRESVLFTEPERFRVSHNFACIDPEHIPDLLYEKMVLRNEGIGKAMSQLRIESKRKITNYGWRSVEEAVDCFNHIIELQVADGERSIPFKEYTLTFARQRKPGIRLIEYFNPQIFRSPIHSKNQDREDYPYHV